jgi:hypothetical protein
MVDLAYAVKTQQGQYDQRCHQDEYRPEAHREAGTNSYIQDIHFYIPCTSHDDIYFWMSPYFMRQIPLPSVFIVSIATRKTFPYCTNFVHT